MDGPPRLIIESLIVGNVRERDCAVCREMYQRQGPKLSTPVQCLHTRTLFIRLYEYINMFFYLV